MDMTNQTKQDNRVEVRVNSNTLDSIKKACKTTNVTISDFIRVSIDMRLKDLKNYKVI